MSDVVRVKRHAKCNRGLGYQHVEHADGNMRLDQSQSAHSSIACKFIYPDNLAHANEPSDIGAMFAVATSDDQFHRHVAGQQNIFVAGKL